MVPFDDVIMFSSLVALKVKMKNRVPPVTEISSNNISISVYDDHGLSEPDCNVIRYQSRTFHHIDIITLVARFMGLTWGPPGADRTQVIPMTLAIWVTTNMLVSLSRN